MLLSMCSLHTVLQTQHTGCCCQCSLHTVLQTQHTGCCCQCSLHTVLQTKHTECCCQCSMYTVLQTQHTGCCCQCSLHTLLQTQHTGCCCQHCKPALSLHVCVRHFIFFIEMCIFSKCLVKVPKTKLDGDPPSVVLTDIRGWVETQTWRR